MSDQLTLEPDAGVGTRGGPIPPMTFEDARALLKAHRAEEYAAVKKLIVQLARIHGFFHAEQLAGVRIDQRNIIGVAVRQLRSEGVIVEGRHRKGSNAASHGRRSYEYHLAP